MARDTTICAPGDDGVAERWGRLWDLSPQRTAFSRLEFVTALASATELDIAVLFVALDREDVAAAAVPWKRRGPYREILVPPLTPFSAVVLRKEPAENEIHGRTSELEHLLEALEDRFDVVRLHLPPALSDVRPASWRGWIVQPFYTYVAPLPSPVSGWSANTARTFEKLRPEYEASFGDGPASDLARLCAAGYRRHGRRPPYDEDRLEAIVEAVTAAGPASVYSVRSRASGAVEAAAVIVRAGAEASYWLAGSEPGPAMTVLIGELLENLAAGGVTHLDFVGANTPGIAEFKRKFGSTLLPYYRVEHIGRRELRLLYSIRSILR